MANPFLVIGGVAVGVVTAGIGVMQVPGWIDSANDSAVREDLSQVSIAQEAAYTVASIYADDLDTLKTGEIERNGDTYQSGVEIQPSNGVTMVVDATTEADEWAAVGVSKSGHVFLRTSESAQVFSSDSKDLATAITEVTTAYTDAVADADNDAELAVAISGATLDALSITAG